MAALRKFAATAAAAAATRSPLIPASLHISHRGIASKLFVGGLSFSINDQGLQDAFSRYGQVIEAKVVTDRASDRSKGFGFVTYASAEEAEKAISGQDGKELNGRVVFVDHAKPKSSVGRGGGMIIARGPPESAEPRITDDNPFSL